MCGVVFPQIDVQTATRWRCVSPECTRIKPDAVDGFRLRASSVRTGLRLNESDARMVDDDVRQIGGGRVGPRAQDSIGRGARPRGRDDLQSPTAFAKKPAALKACGRRARSLP